MPDRQEQDDEARFAFSRGHYNGASEKLRAGPEREPAFARPNVKTMKLPSKFPDLPWKSKNQ